MNKETAIYTLSDPRTGAVRYVGKSERPDARFRDHVSRPCSLSAAHKGRKRGPCSAAHRAAMSAAARLRCDRARAAKQISSERNNNKHN